MKACMKKCPLLFAIIGLATIVLAVQVIPKLLMPYLHFGTLELGIREIGAAVLVLLVYLLFAGKRDFKFTPLGFGYGFRVMRYLFILYGVFAVISIVRITIALINPDTVEFTLLSLLNAVMIGLTVGIVEEFTFRGMVFGGLTACFGRTKKGVLLAAVISSVLFGFIHVGWDVINGIPDIWGWAQVVGKTVQAGLMGFILALLYFKTRNIWAVVILHGLNDFLIFLMEVTEGIGASGYVHAAEEATSLHLVGLFSAASYFLFSLLTVPLVVRVVRELKKEEEPLVLPMDDEFLPRRVFFQKKKKKTAEPTVEEN